MRTGGPLLASGVLFLLVACAQKFTPQQEWVMDNFESCKMETKSWNAQLDRVETDGRMHISSAQTVTDANRVVDCMKARLQREREKGPQPK